ncbi:hypothetical protein EDC96DRAFT_545152 [Choanephora cucurbitarum]|nr:hypothetical protein EDC96DRAFT_545152 [Choanephora cucurbitarum]
MWPNNRDFVTGCHSFFFFVQGDLVTPIRGLFLCSFNPINSYKGTFKSITDADYNRRELFASCFCIKLRHILAHVYIYLFIVAQSSLVILLNFEVSNETAVLVMGTIA